MIRFRAWNKENESYLYDVQDTYDTNESCFGDFLLDNERYAVEQFTGLTDVNGREIYVGDIVTVWSDVSELAMTPTINEIVSEDYFGRAGIFLKPLRPHVIEPCLHDSWNNQFEVIGNAHTNPELLEADK